MNYKCEMMNAKLNRIFQFPVEIFFCIIVVLSHFSPTVHFYGGKETMEIHGFCLVVN